jgi:hypothetical protein
MKVLIFSAIGDYDQKTWLSNETNADFILAYYGKSKEKFEDLKKKSLYCFRSKGVKFQLLWSWWIHNIEKTKEYDIIGVIDDDIQWDFETMNKFIEDIIVYSTNNPDTVVFSPSHNINGKITIAHMEQQLSNHEKTRQVNMVEMTWPFFKTDFLDSYLRTDYEISLQGYGEDRFYSTKAKNEKKNLVIFDNFSSSNPTNIQKGIKKNEMSGAYPFYAHIFDLITKSKK